LAVENAVIPYGVGVDIGCRMCLSIYDRPAGFLEDNRNELKKIIHANTRFGFDAFEKPMDDEIFERREFREIPKVKSLRQKAVDQIGSSGGGNHFVEFGLVSLESTPNALNLPPGTYLAVLSHSGSRGMGAAIAGYYTKIAMEKTLLPKQAKHLAWLNLDSEEGQEYWQAMNLAGDYALACHHHIHHRLGKALGEAYCASRKPPQFCLERNIAGRPGGDRTPKGRYAGQKGGDGSDPRFHDGARIYRLR